MKDKNVSKKTTATWLRQKRKIQEIQKKLKEKTKKKSKTWKDEKIVCLIKGMSGKIW